MLVKFECRHAGEKTYVRVPNISRIYGVKRAKKTLKDYMGEDGVNWKKTLIAIVPDDTVITKEDTYLE